MKPTTVIKTSMKAIVTGAGLALSITLSKLIDSVFVLLNNSKAVDALNGDNADFITMQNIETLEAVQGIIIPGYIALALIIFLPELEKIIGFVKENNR